MALGKESGIAVRKQDKDLTKALNKELKYKKESTKGSSYFRSYSDF